MERAAAARPREIVEPGAADGAGAADCAARPAGALSVDPARGAPRSHPRRQSGVAQRAVLCGARGRLHRPLVVGVPDPGERVPPPGSRGGHSLQCARPPVRSRFHDRLRDRHHPCGLRLDRRTGAHLVQRRVRRLRLRGHVSRRLGGHHAGGGLSSGPRETPRRPARPRLQSGRVHVRLHRVLGLHRVCPVSPHVVRQHAGGGLLVQGASAGAVGCVAAGAGGVPLPGSVSGAHPARGQDRAAAPRLRRRHHAVGALARPVLDGLSGSRHRACFRLA